MDDLARAVVFCLELSADAYRAATLPQCSHLNIGTGADVTIAELARLIADAVGFAGELEFDTTKPDGTPRKLLDTSAVSQLGWAPTISLDEGLRDTYEWYLKNTASLRVQ